MYIVDEGAINRLNETAEILWSKLQASPLWGLLREESEIKNFLLALREVESICKRQNSTPEVKANDPRV